MVSWANFCLLVPLLMLGACYPGAFPSPSRRSLRDQPQVPHKSVGLIELTNGFDFPAHDFGGARGNERSGVKVQRDAEGNSLRRAHWLNSLANTLVRQDQDECLPSCGSVDLVAGDLVRVTTPGGGGFQRPD